MKSLIVAFFLITAALVVPAGMAADTPSATMAAAQDFTQKFYDWYVKQDAQDDNDSAEDIALKTKPRYFDAGLMKALKEDLAAAAKSPDEIVGLDFDPIMNTQDTCGPYKTGKVTQEGDTYRVEVFGTCTPEKPGQPDVIPALTQVQGAWIFVNFYYPGNGDLLTVLQDLKKEREHPSN